MLFTILASIVPDTGRVILSSIPSSSHEVPLRYGNSARPLKVAVTRMVPATVGQYVNDKSRCSVLEVTRI